MPRGKKCRHIGSKPNATYYKPKGIPLCELDEVSLSLDEFEAIRLADLERMDQVTAAGHMGISRATFGRILERAHRAIAEALVQGKAIAIENAEHCVLKGEQDEHRSSEP